MDSTVTLSCEKDVNEYITTEMKNDKTEEIDVMMILSIIIASIGILANLTVIVVFLNHKIFRKKILNMFIISQVRVLYTFILFTIRNTFHFTTYSILKTFVFKRVSL